MPRALDNEGTGPGRLRAALVGPSGVEEGVIDDIEVGRLGKLCCR